MLSKKLKIKDTVDVFVSETESPETVLVVFHKMTTRDRIELMASKSVAEMLALLNGKSSVLDILRSLGDYDEAQAIRLFEFLYQQHLIVDICDDIDKDPRYKRQIAYFDDMVLDRTGEETQKVLESKKVVILGCGAVGSAIAEILVRAGVLDITLIDHKKLTTQNINRHLFANSNDIDKYKPVALADYLSKINNKLKSRIYCEMLLPSTDLSKWIANDSSLVINGCDEPYIGHTSLKIGRYLNERNIAFFVMGGFDAHLMSSGELILPPKTPCIDCAQQTFTKALGAWKPVYSTIETAHSQSDSAQPADTNYIAGGPGGMAMMSGFSASMATLTILQYLMEDSRFDYNIRRHEYLINKGEMTEFSLQKQEQCNVCNK